MHRVRRHPCRGGARRPTVAMIAPRSTFGWVRPRTLADALGALAEDPTAIPIAGGTDLMVTIGFGTQPPARLVDLSGLDELRGITVMPTETIIGASATYTEIAEH